MFSLSIVMPSTRRLHLFHEGKELLITLSMQIYQADNVDHASKTMDGNDTVHVMGQMATFTPGIKTARKVPRLTVNLADLKKIGHVKLVTQQNPKAVLGKMIYGKLGGYCADEQNSNLDILWRTSLHYMKPRPLWSGSMQMLHSNMPHPEKSSAIFLPIIDLTPSDPTAVRSTLEYMSDHAKEAWSYSHHNI